ncbi:MAG: carbonic anhydrase [Candidatus Omnitrophica bacterium]|nr:carbonic anhydrase [Candidatus Omnitrophota bacterium]
MRLFEAIIDANHRAAAGDPTAGLQLADYSNALPVVALTCIDPRLNPLMPEVLGIAEEDFIWLRNAGNVITHPLSSTIRSLALACALKGGKEIAIIGHTDCRVSHTTVLELTDLFLAQGIDRAQLPSNLNEFFGLFASERQNVINAVENARRSPLIGPAIPVHGLLVDIQSGQLEWLVNGYQTGMRQVIIGEPAAGSATEPAEAAPISSAPSPMPELGQVRFPQNKIGEGLISADKWLAEMRTASASASASASPSTPGSAPAKAQPSKPPRIPLPPRIRPTIKKSH